MGQFQRCDSCGAVMQTDSASCPICASPYGSVAAAPAAPVAAPPLAAGSSVPPPAARPDPYAQIANPLHTGWGTTPAAAPEPPPTQLTVRRRRSPWLRRGVLLLVVALLGIGLWSQRDKIEDAVDDLTAGTENSLVSPSWSALRPR